MCLSDPKPIKNKNKTSGIGYKVFGVKDRILTGDCYDIGPKRVPGKWLVTSLPGWHIFKSRTAATKWMAKSLSEAVVKVKYRKAISSGSQYCGKALTAHEIFITKEEFNKAIKSVRM